MGYRARTIYFTITEEIKINFIQGLKCKFYRVGHRNQTSVQLSVDAIWKLSEIFPALKHGHLDRQDCILF